MTDRQDTPLCAVCRRREADGTLLDVWYCERCADREDVAPPRDPSAT